MTTPFPPPGRYPDPSGAPGQQYFDGKDWTEHRVSWAAPPKSPAGWYPDPSGTPGQRYFDGNDWTEHRVSPPTAANYSNPPGRAAIITGIQHPDLGMGRSRCGTLPDRRRHNRGDQRGFAVYVENIHTHRGHDDKQVSTTDHYVHIGGANLGAAAALAADQRDIAPWVDTRWPVGQSREDRGLARAAAGCRRGGEPATTATHQ